MTVTRLDPNRSPRTMETVTESELRPDRRAERRADRKAKSRAEILDAAEKVFGEDGIRDGSLRKIAELAGFSPAAIYLFFENKQDLLSETCIRRADEWDNVVREVAESDMDPMDKVHRVIDLGIAFFGERPHFRLLLRHIRGGPAVTGPVLAEFADNVDARYLEVVLLVARIIHEGQAGDQIRPGNDRSVAHLFLVLLNEFVLFGVNSDESNLGILTAGQFHDFIDGALRSPSWPNSPSSSNNETRHGRPVSTARDTGSRRRTEK
jgi:AcrR family transcriptional regulator